MSLLRLLIALTFAVDASGQSIIHVPMDHATIQAAVDAAATGDTVVVAPGVYNEFIDIAKEVTVRSECGPDLTHIVWSQQGPFEGVVRLDGQGCSIGPCIEGFTIRDSLFGVMVRGPATVRLSEIRNHLATGMTLVAQFGEILVESCRITDNVGAAGTQIDSNVNCFGSPDGRVGGVWVVSNLFNSVVRDCLVSRNTGGDAAAVVFPCTGLPGDGGTGGIDDFGLLIIENCCVTDNIGGATILGAPGAGGLRYSASLGPIVRNSIVHSNNGQDLRIQFPIGPPATPISVAYSNVGGFVGTGPGVIDVCPQFVDPAIGDYHLTASSPCRDTGNQAIGTISIVDLDGTPRVIGANVDMGCYEYVTPLPGTSDGLELRTTIDGEGADLHRKFAPGGSGLIASIEDDLGALAGAVPVLLGQVFGNDTRPVGIPSFPLHLDFPGLAIFHDGNATQWPLIGPIPVSFGPVTMPPGLAGLTLRLQAFGLTQAADNAIYAATHARDLEFQ